jgi:hypothetical protein
VGVAGVPTSSFGARSLESHDSGLCSGGGDGSNPSTPAAVVIGATREQRRRGYSLSARVSQR